jgi:hypothetical protein
MNENWFQYYIPLMVRNWLESFFLINVLVISSFSLSFKGYQIYLRDVKEYLFYFDDQKNYKNKCMDHWTDLTIYQFIIFGIIVFWIFHSNSPFFLISIYCRKIKQNLSWVRLDFHKFILFLIVKSKLYFGGSDDWPHAIVFFWIFFLFFFPLQSSQYRPMKYFYWCLPMNIVKTNSIGKIHLSLPIEKILLVFPFIFLSKFWYCFTVANLAIYIKIQLQQKKRSLKIKNKNKLLHFLHEKWGKNPI